MSELERNKGKLTYYSSLEEFAKEKGIEDDGMGLQWEVSEYIYENEVDGVPQYMINHNTGDVYKAEFEAHGDSDMSLTEVHKEEDTITFHTIHYNGGGSLEEVIFDSLKRQEKEDGKVS